MTHCTNALPAVPLSDYRFDAASCLTKVRFHQPSLEQLNGCALESHVEPEGRVSDHLTGFPVLGSSGLAYVQLQKQAAVSSSQTPVRTPAALGPSTSSLHDAGFPLGCLPELHSHTAWLTAGLSTDSQAAFAPATSKMPCLQH